MRLLLPLAAAWLIASAGGTSHDRSPLFNLQMFGDGVEDDSSTVVVTVQKSSKHTGSSQSSSLSSSRRNLLVEHKNWELQHVNTGESQHVVSSSRLSRKESGSSGSAESSSKAASSGQRDTNSLAVGGRKVVSHEKGRSSVFNESSSSSEAADFKKAIEAEVTKRVTRQKLSLGCLTRHRINVFLLLQLSASWRQKLQLARRLVEEAYQPDKVTFTFVLFNQHVDSFATFGLGGLSSKEDLLWRLDSLADQLQHQEAGRSRDWTKFSLRRALQRCGQYAGAVCKRSTDAPCLLLSYFDTSVTPAPDAAGQAAAFFADKSTNLFRLRLNILQQQQQQQQQVAAAWQQLAAAMSSSERLRLARPHDAQLLDLMAQLVDSVCQAKFLR